MSERPTLRAAERIIQAEIDWCHANPDKGPGGEQRRWFVKGLEQARYLVEKFRAKLEGGRWGVSDVSCRWHSVREIDGAVTVADCTLPADDPRHWPCCEHCGCDTQCPGYETKEQSE